MSLKQKQARQQAVQKAIPVQEKITEEQQAMNEQPQQQEEAQAAEIISQEAALGGEEVSQETLDQETREVAELIQEADQAAEQGVEDNQQENSEEKVMEEDKSPEQSEPPSDNVEETYEETAVEDVQETESQQAEETEGLSENAKYLKAIEDGNATDVQKRILKAVQNFCEQLKPRTPLQSQEANLIQDEFLGHLLWLLDKDYDEFRKGWATLLVYFDEHHGQRPTRENYTALSEYNTNRYTHAWQDNDRREAYANLITLLRSTRRLDTRKQDAKRVTLDLISQELVKDKRLENLVRFYA